MTAIGYGSCSACRVWRADADFRFTITRTDSDSRPKLRGADSEESDFQTHKQIPLPSGIEPSLTEKAPATNDQSTSNAVISLNLCVLSARYICARAQACVFHFTVQVSRFSRTRPHFWKNCGHGIRRRRKVCRVLILAE